MAVGCIFHATLMIRRSSIAKSLAPIKYAAVTCIIDLSNVNEMNRSFRARETVPCLELQSFPIFRPFQMARNVQHFNIKRGRKKKIALMVQIHHCLCLPFAAWIKLTFDSRCLLAPPASFQFSSWIF